MRLGGRAEILPAQAEVDSQVRTHFPIVLCEQSVIGRAQGASGIGRSSGDWINVDLFENGSAVGHIPEPLKDKVRPGAADQVVIILFAAGRSEEHTAELQSLRH